MTETNRAAVLMYHYVRDIAKSRYPGIKGLEIKQFKEQLDYLEENFNIIDPNTLFNAYSGGELPERAVCLSFDDGYIDHYTNVFPELKKRGLTAFFSMPGRIIAERKVLDVNKLHFILAGAPIEDVLGMVYERLDFYRRAGFDIAPNDELFKRLGVAGRFDPAEVIFVKRLLQAELDETLRARITDEIFASVNKLSEEAFARELYMNLDQLALMAREGMVIGLHGYDHYWMNRLSPEALKEDIQKAKDVFAGIIDAGAWIFCYPYGSVSDDVVATAKSMGCIGGMTTVVDFAKPSLGDVFRIERFDTNDFPPKSFEYKRYL